MNLVWVFAFTECRTTSTSADDVHSNPDITPEIHNDLLQQLKHNYKHIRYQYASYIRCIRVSLGEKGVTVKELSSYLLSLPAFNCDVQNEDYKLMSQKRNDLEGANDIIDIFNIIARDHASFLEYDIFQGIVREHKLDRSQEPLQYPDHLKAYIQKHTIAEFMELYPALKRYNGEKELTLKFELKLLDRKIATLLDLKNAIAAILGVQSSALRLLSAREGCLVLQFLIPEFITSRIFAEKLTSKQVKNFQELSVIWLKCAGCEFTFEDTGTQG